MLLLLSSFLLLSLFFSQLNAYKEVLSTRELGAYQQVLLEFKQEAPRNIATLFNAFPSLQLIELSFGQQRWEYEEWGRQPAGLEKPMGVYLRVQHLGGGSFDWERFVGVLGGMFCASLSLLKEVDLIFTSTTTSSGLETTLEGLLPREAVCTENLTPWTKLLPCGSGKAGLGTLLIPQTIYNSR